MPTSRPASAGQRGPIARRPALSPTGFRIDDRTRFELQMAMAFTGRSTLQAVLDLAVSEFLENLRQEEGFESALRAAEASHRRRHGVSSLPTTGRQGTEVES